MSEIGSHVSTEQSSEKSFGVVFSIVFLIIALYPLISSEGLRIWALVVSSLFLLFAYVAPKVLLFPNKLWFKFGLLLGSIISPIVMAMVYFIVVMPTGIIMRLLGKDLLKMDRTKSTSTYWIKREKIDSTMKKQF